jgi:hypothetical protein
MGVDMCAMDFFLLLINRRGIDRKAEPWADARDDEDQFPLS